jgi:DnaJ-class molecular chaperone with C-terminal Zn finger domain
MKDYYKTLQVDPEAEPEVIEGAYRRLANKYYPRTAESAASAEANARMAEINEAYEALRDKARRAEYDRMRISEKENKKTRPPTPKGKPRLEVWPPEVVIEDVDPEDGILTFSITLRQVGGTPYDPAVHKLYLNPAPPWDRARFQVLGQDADRPPMTIEIEADVSEIEMQEATSYSGELDVVVEVER